MSITQPCAEVTEAQSVLWSEALPPTGREGELRRRRSRVTSRARWLSGIMCWETNKENETFEWIDRQLGSGS